MRRRFYQKPYVSTAPVRRPAGGRKNRTIFGQLLDIVRCPVKFRHYLKFHGARTAFCRVIEGTFVKRHLPGTVRCLKSAMNFRNSLNKSTMTVRAPDVLARAPADVLWVETPPVRSDVYLQKYTLHRHRYFTSKDQNYKYWKKYFA